MRKFFILSFVANLALTLISLDILPNCVALYFGPGGAPNGWGSKYVGALFFLVIQTLLFFDILLLSDGIHVPCTVDASFPQGLLAQG